MWTKVLALGAMAILFALSIEFIVCIIKQHIRNMTRIELFEMELERGYNTVIAINKERYPQKNLGRNRCMKEYNDYLKEHDILLNMYRCSERYLAGREGTSEKHQSEILQMQRDMKELYEKYARKIDKKCKKNTGKSIFEGLVKNEDK